MYGSVPLRFAQLVHRESVGLQEDQIGRRVREAQDRAPQKILRQVRIERGWSQQALAFHLGVCTTTVVNIERGLRTPQPELEKKIREWIATHPRDQRRG